MKCPVCDFKNLPKSQFCSKCGQPFQKDKVLSSATKTMPTPVFGLAAGSTFASRYLIVEELGRGGICKVYRVDDTKLKQEISLKLIKP